MAKSIINAESSKLLKFSPNKLLWYLLLSRFTFKLILAISVFPLQLRYFVFFILNTNIKKGIAQNGS